MHFVANLSRFARMIIIPVQEISDMEATLNEASIHYIDTRVNGIRSMQTENNNACSSFAISRPYNIMKILRVRAGF